MDVPSDELPVRIGIVDIPRLAGAGRPLAFDGKDAFLDFDMVVLDLVPFIQRILPKDGGILSRSRFIALEAIVVRRLKELTEFLHHGKFAIVFAAAAVLVRTESQYRRFPEFPGYTADWTEQLGTAIQSVATNNIAEFFHALAPLLDYRAVTDDLADAVAHITGTKKVVAKLHRIGGSYLLIMPEISGNPSIAEKCKNAFVKLYHSLGRKTDLLELPQWHIRFLLPEEASTRSEMTALLQESARVSESIARAQQRIQEFEALKAIFATKGTPLVDAVVTLLGLLGYSVEPGAIGRDDLIATADGRTLAIEVKGRDNAGAAESHAAQLEKWVAGQLENGIKAKGLLIVNGFKDVELDKRSEPVFPDQMLRYSVQREHALMSGLQLLCLSLSSATEAEKLSARDEIFTTVGVFVRFRDMEWQSVLVTSSAGEPQ